MDIEAGEIYIGSFVALGANIGVPPDRIHGGKVVINGSYGLGAVTLTTGDACPSRMKIPCLMGMTLDAGSPFVKLEPLM